MNDIKTVLVTGGAGYVGSVLVAKLLAKNYIVNVLDWYIYGDSLRDHRDNPHLLEIKGDIRDKSLLKKILRKCNAVIHLACISNDASFDLQPKFSTSVNYGGTRILTDSAKQAGVKRFIFVSSSSVYGVKKNIEVTEDLALSPLTRYSRYKALAEQYVLSKQDNNFTVLILRPATVCGYSPRLRLDLTVHILTMQALIDKKITVFGGSQLRPNIHIDDITDLYLKTLSYPKQKIAGKIFNAGGQNLSIGTIAQMVKKTIGDKNITISTLPTKDLRSYKISSKKIQKELGFVPKKTVVEAIRDIKNAYEAEKIPNALDDDRYYNVRTMQREGKYD